LDKLERVEAVRETKTIRIEFPEAEEVFGQAFEFSGVSKGFGSRRLFSGIHLAAKGGERVGLFGSNGSGKTTLLRILAGKLKPDSGEVWWSRKTRPAYYEQGAEDELNEDVTVLETILRVGSGYTENQLKGILGVFLFKGDEVEKKVRVLSGGERSRLAIIKVLLTPSNLLILDEPTNHLDIQSREILFDAISRYRRTVVFAAHDRYMLDRLADKTVKVEAGEVLSFPGNYAYASAHAKVKTQTRKPQTTRQRPGFRERSVAGKGKSDNRKPETTDPAGRMVQLEQRLANTKQRYEEARRGFDLNRARELMQAEKLLEEEIARLRAQELADSAESEN